MLRAVVVLGVWGVGLILLAGAVLRMTWHDGAVPLIWFNAFTPYVYLPIYVVLLVAWWLKRRVLVAMSLAIAACHLVWIVPDLLPAKSEDPSGTSNWDSPHEPVASADGLRQFRVLCHNVWTWNDAYDTVYAEFEAADPDVLYLTEFSRLWYRAGKQRGFFDRYAYSTTPGRYTGQDALYSKYPIKILRRHAVVRRQIIQAVLDVDGTPLQVVGVHVPRPLPEGSEHQPLEYNRYFEKLLEVVADGRGPRVVLGDFNATQHARWYQRVVAERLRSAHNAVGRGWATSWPNGQDWLPPIRIDHVLISPNITCLNVWEGRGAGSDHKPIIADLCLPGDPDGEEE